jgi:hypothetical protein
MLTLERVASDEEASRVGKVGGSSKDVGSAMCVPGAARGEYSSIPDEGAVTIIGLRSAAATVESFQLSEGEGLDGEAVGSTQREQ